MHRNATRSRKILLTLTAVAVTAGLAGMATFATFTSTVTKAQNVSSGIVALTAGTDDTAGNRLTVAASDIVPGDTIERGIVLTDASTDNPASLVLATSATTSSVLDTNATNGLKMDVDECLLPWVETGVAPAYTYTCVAGSTPLVTAQPVIGTYSIYPTGVTAGSSHNLRVRLTLPATADNTFQDKASVISYAFTSTQRAATNK